MNWIDFKRVALLAIVVVLTGCATYSTEGPIPTDGPTMLEIYRQASGPAIAKETVQALCGTTTGRRVPRECAPSARTSPPIPQEQQAGRVSVAFDGAPVSPPIYPRFTRTPTNQTEVLFRRLPNPDIAVYVYPHLATEHRVPVPGYTTVLPLYPQVEYAMPGELAEENP